MGQNLSKGSFQYNYYFDGYPIPFPTFPLKGKDYAMSLPFRGRAGWGWD